MSVEENRDFAGQIGTLGSCLIEGDSEQKSRERRTKRRALAISVTLQFAVLVVLVLVPLLGHTEKIVYRGVIPMPPYRHQTVKPAEQPHTAATPPPTRCGFCAPTRIPPHIVTVDHTTPNKAPIGEGEINLGRDPNSPDGGGLIDLLGRTNTPAPPEDPNRNQKKRLVRGGDVQQAMLVRRVDPPYPPLMRQIRRSGKVEIRAIISTDGTIESLEVISGDPGFYQSALTAVGQWRYRPTILNGQPVEVETIITVVYTLNQ
jgi:periplasmic protein TonB